MKNVYPELCRRFDIQNTITFEEMKNLALSIESTERESKARVEETSVSVNVAESEDGTKGNKNKPKSVVCFRCGRPNHLASVCTNPKKICYNCGKYGTHEQKECTAPKMYYPPNAKFPSGRVGKTRGQAGGIFRGRGRGRFSQREEKTYKRVKMTGADGKEKYVMICTADDSIYKIGELNLAEGESLNVKCFKCFCKY